MKLLLLGKNGQVGWELARSLQPLGDLLACGREDVDITDYRSLRSLLTAARPDIVINAAGYNDVDAAEDNKELALEVNANANSILAEQAAHSRAFLISYSSDYVFDGIKGSPYTEADKVNPINTYGKSKLAGEKAVLESGANFLIIRTSSVYSLRRPCFLTKVLAAIRSGQKVKAVTDLVSSPTSALCLAEITAQVIGMGGKDYKDWLVEHKGIYHFSGDGHASRYEWACAIVEFLNMDVGIIPLVSADFPSRAHRPAFSALDSHKFNVTFHIQSRSWKQLLITTLDEIS